MGDLPSGQSLLIRSMQSPLQPRKPGRYPMPASPHVAPLSRVGAKTTSPRRGRPGADPPGPRSRRRELPVSCICEQRATRQGRMHGAPNTGTVLARVLALFLWATTVQASQHFHPLPRAGPMSWAPAAFDSAPATVFPNQSSAGPSPVALPEDEGNEDQSEQDDTPSSQPSGHGPSSGVESSLPRDQAPTLDGDPSSTAPPDGTMSDQVPPGQVPETQVLPEQAPWLKPSADQARAAPRAAQTPESDSPAPPLLPAYQLPGLPALPGLLPAADQDCQTAPQPDEPDCGQDQQHDGQ